MADFEFDLTEISQALRDYQKVTNKDAADVLNRFAVKVAFRAAQRTPLGKTGEIKKHDPAKKVSGGGKRAASAQKEKKLFHAIATGGTKKGKSKQGAAVKGKGNRDVAVKIFNRRQQSKGYSKAIFYRIAGDFGAKLRGKFNIKHARGIKAKPGIRAVAKLEADQLEQSHVDTVMADAMKSAMFDQVDDMKAYMERKLAERAREFSAR